MEFIILKLNRICVHLHKIKIRQININFCSFKGISIKGIH